MKRLVELVKIVKVQSLLIVEAVRAVAVVAAAAVLLEFDAAIADEMPAFAATYGNPFLLSAEVEIQTKIIYIKLN